MKLNDKVRTKIANLRINPEAMLELFDAVTADAFIRELPSATCVVLCYEDGDLEPGEYAAELHFVVRKVAEPEPESEEVSND